MAIARPSPLPPDRNLPLLIAAAAAGTALLLTLVLVVAAVTNYIRTGDGIGGDFLTDYAGGHLIWSGDGASLYDLETQEATQYDLSPAGRDDDVNPFVAPPAVAWLFAPLTAIPYVPAHILFTTLNLAALAGAVLLLRRELVGVPPLLANTLLAVFALSMPAVTNITWGQIDLVIVYAALLGWRGLRDGHDVFAGASLSLLALKPHFLIGVVLLLVVQRRWTTLATLAAIAIPVTVLPALALGPDALRDYAGLVTGATALPEHIDTQPQHMANWRGLVTSLSGSDNVLYWLPGAAALAAVALFLAARTWRADPRSPRAYALAITLPLVLSPHVHMQSMMVLFIAIALIVGHTGARNVSLGRWSTDGTTAILWLGVALFGGWFLTANNIALMVIISAAIFTWCAFPTPAAAAEQRDDALPQAA